MMFGTRPERRALKAFRSIGAVLLACGSLGAHAITVLLDENFDDVTGLALASDERTIADILANNPAELPAGTTFITPSSAGDINVRRADNAINTLGSSAGFSSSFTSQFLVLGDRDDEIGEPPGGDPPNNGMSVFRLPFTLAAGFTSATFSFDYAFNGTSASNGGDDIFTVRVLDAGTTASLITLAQYDQNDFGSSGMLALVWNAAVSGSYLLEFRLSEGPGSPQNSAVGLDNIVISAVPLPAPIVLLLSALGALVLTSNRGTVSFLGRRGRK